MSDAILIEIASYTPRAAMDAARAGASRIELCSGYSEGGLSPSAGAIKLAREVLNIPLHVMIRPRIGDFIYGDFEKEVILADIFYCKQLDIDGVVLGTLLHNGEIDKEFTQQVVETAYPMSVTFHRAFDLCTDLSGSLEALISCGVKRVLTSGGKQDAIAGTEIIAGLVQQAGDRIIILPGGGLRPDNLPDFIRKTKVSEIHLSAKKPVYSAAATETTVNLTSHGETGDHKWFECDPEMIARVKEIVAGS